MLLVIEDESYRRNWFIKAFREQKIHFASELNDVIELLSNNKYDIIFLDHDLSTRTDGVQIATAMSMQKLQTETPVIIHSDNNVGSSSIRKVLKDTHNVIEIPFYCFSGRRYWLNGDKLDVDNDGDLVISESRII